MIFHSSLLKLVIASFVCVVCAGTALSVEGDTWLRAGLAKEWGADSTALALGDDVNRHWWQSFDDPLLDSLIMIGERNNYDVSIAARRIDIARSALKQTQSAYYPQIGLSLGWNRTRTSGRIESNRGVAETVSYFDGTANMSWEIDVFGKIRAQSRRGAAQVKVSSAEYAAAMLSLDAEIASTYIGLLVSRAQLDIAMLHSERQKHILDITETRHRTGLVSKLDVAQAATL